MNFLLHQIIANGGRLPDGPHYEHCYIYEGAHCSCGGNYQGTNPGPDLTAYLTLGEQFRQVNEELVIIASPEADRVRDLLKEAVDRRDVETVRREGYYWSGRVALLIFELADRLEEMTSGAADRS